jgi:hypothetical protein
MGNSGRAQKAFGGLALGVVCGAAALAGAGEDYGPGLETLRANALRGHIYFLASDELGGRRALSSEGRVAATYIASFFYRAGLEPAGVALPQPVLIPYREARRHGGARSYFQEFQMVEARLDRERTRLRAKIAGSSGSVTEREYLLGPDFTPGRHWNATVSVEAPLVFAGYGISAPEYGYDDFQGVDVKGKVVLVMAMEPQMNDPRSRFLGSMETYHAYNFYKHEVLRRRGAAAILMVGSDRRTRERPRVPSGPTSGEVDADPPSLTLPPPYCETPLFVITARVADEILRPSGKTLEQLRVEIDRSGRPQSLPLPGVSVVVERTLRELRVIPTRNVVGVLEGSDPRLRDEIVLITAHYDHSGRTNQIVFHGADDDASGTAAVMALAEAFATNPVPPKRSLMFLAVDAEEVGLLGAFHYVENPIVPLEKTVAVLNMDMIGRDEDSVTWGTTAEENRNSVNVVGTPYSPDLRKVIETANQRIGLRLGFRADTEDRENWFAAATISPSPPARCPWFCSIPASTPTITRPTTPGTESTIPSSRRSCAWSISPLTRWPRAPSGRAS